MIMGPPPAAPDHSIPTIPAIHLLTAAIISSSDKLFFVSHSIGANSSHEGALQDSLSMTQYRFIHLAHLTADFCLISTSATLQIGIIMQSINVIGSSTMDKRTLRALVCPRILI